MILRCQGGEVQVPELLLVDRLAGGHLVVNPPRPVWERSELTPQELTQWSFLVAAAGRAMLETLPQLEGGCINYWEAGNWSLHENAQPVGPKRAAEFRRVHLHLLGRSRSAGSGWTWGEAPRFPQFRDRQAWAAKNLPLTGDECRRIAAKAADLLESRYGLRADFFQK